MSNHPLFCASGYPSGARKLLVTLAGWLSFVALLATGGFFIWAALYPCKATKEVAQWWLLGWALLPPVWFWCEYHFIWLTERDESQKPGLAHLQHSQEVSRNIWLAIVGLIAARFFT